MEEFIHDRYTLKAIELVRKGHSFFITGKAGTGKTMLLKKIVQECRARGKNIAVTAPTGIAAKNAEGKTLHSMFGLKTFVFIPGQTRRWYHLDSTRERIIKNLDILIIDEISMVRCDVLDMVDHSLRRIKGNRKPFGGIQVIFFGDLFQLPPVVTEQDEEVLYKHYEKNSPYFFSSDVIKKKPFPILELETVHRQLDEKFVKILNNIREGKYLPSDRATLNKRYKPSYEPSEKDPSIYLRTRNWKVDVHNYSKLKKLPGEPDIFWANVKDVFPENLYPTENPLKLKVGAKVMLIRNDNDNYKFVNGTHGIISSIYDGEIRVKTVDGDLISLEQSKWELYDYVYNEETKTIDPIVIGSFTQYPIKLAWAVTIHKSQGMTFSKAIVDARKSFAPGQVYVALSRCRSLDGLTLTSRITEDDIMVDPKVISYMKNVEKIIPDEVDEDIDVAEDSIFFFSKDGITITGIKSEISGEIEIPEGVEVIAEDAFMENTNISSVICPSSLREIKDHAFWKCGNLRRVRLNDGLISIGQEAFLDTNLKSVEIPYTVEDMGLTPFDCEMKVFETNLNYSDVEGVLYDKSNSSLILYPRKYNQKNIDISISVTTIESYAFECNKAEEIVLPKRIFELGGYLFNGCQNLKTLTIKQDLPKLITIEEDTFNGFEVEKCVLRVPFEALSEYISDERFKDFKYITAIEGSRCLKYDQNGTEVVGCDEEDCESIEIPYGITSIKEDAFKNNEKIESVVFPDSLLDIGHSAFAGCYNLSEIELNEGVKNIEWDAFRGSGLSKVNIPYSVEEIGFSAFSCYIEVDPINKDYCAYNGVLYSYDESELVIYPEYKDDKEFKVPDTVEIIGSFAFEDTSLKILKLPNSIKTIGRNIFNAESTISTLIMTTDNPQKIDIDENIFENFYKRQCKLVVPHGSYSLYASNKHFKDFLSISEMPEEDEGKGHVATSEFNVGQYFDTLPGYSYAESKVFCLYEGHYRCYIVMSSKGFFLKLMGGGYYYMSDLINDSNLGSIWVLNKRDKLSDYMVAYSKDNKTKYSFGRFKESTLEKTLSYTDLKSDNKFVLDVRTGKVLYPQQNIDNHDFFTQKNLKSFYPGISVSGFYKTVYQIFDELPKVDYNIKSITPNTKGTMNIQYSEKLEEEFWVVGLRHHEYYNQITNNAEGISEGDKLELRNEPDNPVDNNAIAVYFKDKKVGYISKEETEDVHELMSLNNDYLFYISSKPNDSFNAIFSTNAIVNRNIKKKCHVNVVAEAELSVLTDEIIDRYSTYINALMNHDIIFRFGYNNQMDVEASRHRFIGTLDSMYLNKRAEQGQIDGKIIKFNIIKDSRIAQIEFEIMYNEYEPRLCYKKLIEGLKTYFKGLKIGNTYDISLERINAIGGKKIQREKYIPFIKYLQDYYLINLNIRD